MREVDVVLFDKTGTLTAAQHAVTGVVATHGDDGNVLALAGAVESNSEHPLAQAIVQAAKEAGDLSGATHFAP
jgi:Cu2+-exporting ATPase